jgi:putative drug exporter of the RND superfamily
MERRQSVAARARRWSAVHRRQAIIGWLLLVVLAATVGSAVGLKTLESDQYGIGSSGRADRAVSDNFPSGQLKTSWCSRGKWMYAAHASSLPSPPS